MERRRPSYSNITSTVVRGGKRGGKGRRSSFFMCQHPALSNWPFGTSFWKKGDGRGDTSGRNGRVLKKGKSSIFCTSSGLDKDALRKKKKMPTKFFRLT